jgi:hypothetical protein
MKSYKLIFLVVLIVVAATAMTRLRGQSQNSSNSPKQDNQKKLTEDFYTITDYDTPELSDPKKRALRQVRSKRYNMRVQKGVDPKRFKITEERDSSFGIPSSHAPIEPAFPVAQSDAVVIGEVTNAEAFLTEDKTSILSEFTVRLNDVLKNCSAATITATDSIDALRGGGAVRFPSGKVIRYGLIGNPLPRIGQRYLFFLKYNNEGQDFSIITAYELRAGRVSPLDGLEWDGNITPQYAAYQKYKDADEATFLTEVREAIASASEGGR